MTSHLSHDTKDLFLGDGRLALQNEEIPLVSSGIHLQFNVDWTFEIAIPSACCQQLLGTWQRMIHEPTYFRPTEMTPAASVRHQDAASDQHKEPAPGHAATSQQAPHQAGPYQTATYQRSIQTNQGVTQSYSSYRSSSSYHNYRSYRNYRTECYRTYGMPPGEGNVHDAPRPGVGVGMFGNNEVGQRRIVYIEAIRELELVLNSFQLDSARVRFRCAGNLNLSSILFVNDGAVAVDDRAQS